MKRFHIILAIVAVSAGTGLQARAEDKPKNAGDDQITLTSGFDFVTVKGDTDRYREDKWQREGWTGGIEDLRLHRALNKDWALDANARAIFGNDDYRVQLQVVNPNFGFVRFAFKRFKKYYDDDGGVYLPFPTGAQEFELQKDLGIDVTDFTVDFGLTLPNLPKIIVGYEHESRDGTKSMIEWGSVSQGATTRKIFPATKDVDENVDIFKLSLDHDIKNIHVGDEFNFERYRNATGRIDDSSMNVTNSPLVPSKLLFVTESFDHNAFYNAFHMDCQLNEYIYWSLGYMFNSLDGGAGFALTAAPLTPGDSLRTSQVDLSQDSHVINGNVFLTPWKTLSLYAGLQYEATDTHALMVGDLATNGVGNVVGHNLTTATTFNDTDIIEGNFGARFTAIPFTTIYAEGKVQSEQIDLTDDQAVQLGGSNVFDLNQDARVARNCFTVGLSCSPVKRATFSAQYRYSNTDNEYSNLRVPAGAYPGYITRQKLFSDEVTTKLTIRPCSRLTLAFKYQLVATDIKSTFDSTPPNSTFTGNYDLSIYSVSVTVTPISRLYLTGLFSFQDTRTSTYRNPASVANNPSLIVQPYIGNVYTILTTAGLVLDNKTDLTATYSYTRADDFRDNSAVGMPYGISEQQHSVQAALNRRIRENVSVQLRYAYYEFNSPSSGGFDNVRAHMFGSSCTVRF